MTHESREFALGPNCVRYLLSGEETGGQYSLTEFTAAPPPAPSAPPHIHHDADEMLYILEGEFRFMRGGETWPAPAGSCIFIPRGTRHAVENVGSAAGRMLVLLTPPGFEQFWRERAGLIARFGDKVEASELVTLQERYRMDTGGQPRQLEGREPERG